MNLQIENGSIFVHDFIGGLARIADTGILKLKNKKFTCLTATGDNTIIVSSSYTLTNISDEVDITLNVPDFKKLHKLLSLLNFNNFIIGIHPNSISYTSDDIKFKMHLYDEGVLSSPSVNIEKINSIPFSNNFIITIDNIKNLAKSSFLLPDIQKIYFTFKDGKVYGEITDKAQHNIDSYTKLLCDRVEGEPANRSLPVNIEVLRLLTSIKEDRAAVKFSSEFGILTFDVHSDKLLTKYIVSGLIN